MPFPEDIEGSSAATRPNAGDDLLKNDRTESILESRWERFGMSRGVMALSIARMADALGNSVLIVLIPLYVAKTPDLLLHVPMPVLIGILISSYGLINTFLQPFTGAMSDRLGRRKVMILIGLALMAVGTLAFIIAGRFVELLGLRIMQGIGVAITVPASMALLAALTRKETRGGSMGVYTTLRLIGFSVGPLLGGFLQVHFGFSISFIVGASFLLLAMTLVQIWVRDVAVAEPVSKVIKFKIVDRSLLTPGIVSAAVATFLMANAFSMVTTLENEFNARLGMNAFGFGLVFSMLMIGRLIFQLPLGKLSDLIGRKPLVITGLLLMAPATALLGEAGSEYHLILLRLFQGLAAAAIAAPAFAVAGDLAQKGGEGRQMALLTMGFGLGIAIGPLLAGVLSVVFFELPFLIGGLMSLVGAWIVYRHMPETMTGPRVLFKQP
jgi:MFS family permease